MNDLWYLASVAAEAYYLGFDWLFFLFFDALSAEVGYFAAVVMVSVLI